VFTIDAAAMSSQRAHYERALKHLERAHFDGQRAGISHLHRAVVAAADDAGVPSGPIAVAWHKGKPYIGIERTPEGDALADIEYGTPDEAPSPVLRQAHRRAFPAANATYAQTLIRQSGLA
jgi:hypothetical protein